MTVLNEDLSAWNEFRKNGKAASVDDFLYYMSKLPEFRSLFCYRLSRRFPKLGRLLHILAKPMPLLYLPTEEIGAGFYIEHGFATIISAKKGGRNCKINQQVTEGWTNSGNPTIGNNVTIGAGAKVLGNCVIGANCVVVKDVPANCVVVGCPAYIVRRNGQRVNEKL